jgi:Outer membrane protein beta-barrel domain
MSFALNATSTARWALGAIAPLLGGAGFMILTALPAAAEPGLEGSYVGVTVDVNQAGESLQELLESGDPTTWLLDQTLGPAAAATGLSSPSTGSAADLTSRQIQGRLDLPNSRISIRGTIDPREQSRAITPMFSYDFPVADNANIYAGAGYTFVEKQSEATTTGDRNGLVLNAGAEAAVGQQFVIYGNVRFSPNAQRVVDGNPVRVQVGIGHRF